MASEKLHRNTLTWGVKCEKFNFRKSQGICQISFETNLYMNRTGNQEFSAFLQLQKIVGNFCFSECRYFTEYSLWVPLFEGATQPGVWRKKQCQRTNPEILNINDKLIGDIIIIFSVILIVIVRHSWSSIRSSSVLIAPLFCRFR